jgi:hypothetical protein
MGCDIQRRLIDVPRSKASTSIENWNLTFPLVERYILMFCNTMKTAGGGPRKPPLE